MKLSRPGLQFIFFLAVLAAGTVLRLIWVQDMEWKADEIWMFDTAIAAAQQNAWSGVGMQSGAYIVNPGLGVWIFSIIGYVADTPTAMTRVVQVFNVVAVFGFVVFAAASLPKEQRRQWYWGLAMVAVGPMYILYSRKIWAQDMLPFFCLVFIVGHHHRDKKSGAFLWGFCGSLLGQIHMSGFFYALGFVLVTAYADHGRKSTWNWKYWLAGSSVGGIGLLPWLLALFNQPGGSGFDWANVLDFGFYYYALLDPLGLNTAYSLGEHFWQFIQMPFVLGIPSYGVAFAHLALIVLGGILVIRTVRVLITSVRSASLGTFSSWLFYRCDYTELCLLGVLAGLGLLMTLSGIEIHSHYLIVAFPFLSIYVARLLLPVKKALPIAVAALLLISTCFLTYIHTNGGAEGSDYGRAYRLTHIAKPAQ